jgi:hypothetical protein
MSINKELLGIYQKSLNQCRSAKLLYLKSADKQHLPEYKRFLNLQATVRNRIYNDLVTLLNAKGVDLETTLLQNAREEIMIARLSSEKQNAFTKGINSDETLIGYIVDIMDCEEDPEALDLLMSLIDKLKISLKTNQTFEHQNPSLHTNKKVS